MLSSNEKKRKKRGDAPGTGKQHTRLSTGELALDFVNTMHPADFLLDLADLIRWCWESGWITEERAQMLLEQTDISPEENNALFERLMALREAAYRVLLALIYHSPPAIADINVLQRLFIEARNQERLVFAEDHFVWSWEPGQSGLISLQWMLARALENILTSSLLGRVKQCPPEQGGCGWFFLDRSKNGSRQWCSDEGCGSRIRMRRLHARKRLHKEV
jgi:predicted RNA-binding Zn ribbon-like protein